MFGRCSWGIARSSSSREYERSPICLGSPSPQVSGSERDEHAGVSISVCRLSGTRKYGSSVWGHRCM